MKTAEETYTEAQLAMKGPKPRWATVIKLLQRAAAMGLPAAQCDMGLWYLTGWSRKGCRIIRRLPNRAFRLLKAAADAGYSSAFLGLGYCYDVGVGTVPNKDAALRWYRRSVRHDGASAAYNIAAIYIESGATSGAK
jgi:TPR repeat protein